MISLALQIKALLFSFLFGFFFAICVIISQKFILSRKKLIRISFTFLFIIVNILIYFIGIKKIDDAFLHPYFILMILTGFIAEIFIQKIIVKIVSKWYNVLRIGDRHEKKKKGFK